MNYHEPIIVLIITSLLALSCSFLFTVILIKTANYHIKWSGDLDAGPQKIHKNPTLRIGGLAIYLGLLAAACFSALFRDNILLKILIVAALPVFLIGFIEDITKNISPQIRMIFAGASGLAFVILSGVSVTKVSMPLFDELLQFWLISSLFTAFCIVLLINAINLIDGVNGLALGTSVFSGLTVLTLSFNCGDGELAALSAVFVGLLIGVGYFNFPSGKIFLGDGGAYLLGCTLAILVILLPERNEAISPFTSLLIIFFPAYETLRTTLRRLFSANQKVLQPDEKHLHSRVYSYLKRRSQFEPDSINSMTGLILLSLPAISSLFALIKPDSAEVALAGIMILIICYEIAGYLIRDELTND